MEIGYFLALVSAVIYTMAAMCLRRGAQGGMGTWTTLVFLMLTNMVLILPVMVGGVEVRDWGLMWAPVVASMFSFLGALFLGMSLRAGDVSVQTPLMGVKVLFVAGYSAVWGGMGMTMSTWVGAVLTVVAILVLGLSDIMRKGVPVKMLSYVLLACGSFGVTDLIAGKYGREMGVWVFTVVMLMSYGFPTLVVILVRGKEVWPKKREVWKWGVVGASLMSLQNILLLVALGMSKNITGVNIVYSTRGLISIGAIYFVGHWFGNTERHLGQKTLMYRLVGATVLMVAVVLVLMD